MYYFPTTIDALYLLTGYNKYSCYVDEQDIDFCHQQYTACKPSPLPEEFIDLVNILMEENGWFMPETCKDALEHLITDSTAIVVNTNDNLETTHNP